MPHPLVKQLRFTRREFSRGLRNVSPQDGLERVGRLNSLGWSVGHLAWQEQKYFLYWGSGSLPYPQIDKAFRSGAAASTPDLHEMLGSGRRSPQWPTPGSTRSPPPTFWAPITRGAPPSAGA